MSNVSASDYLPAFSALVKADVVPAQAPSQFQLYNPLFETATPFEALSNTLAIYAGGGIVSNAAGTVAKGSLRMPFEPDFRKVGRAEAVVSWSRTSGDAFVFGLGSGTAFWCPNVQIGCGNPIPSYTGGVGSATITWTYNHGLTAGDTFTIAGATGTTVNLNGSWTVASVSSATICVCNANSGQNTSSDTGYTGSTGKSDSAYTSGSLVASSNSNLGVIPAGTKVCLAIGWAYGTVTGSIHLLGTGSTAMSANSYLKSFTSGTVLAGTQSSAHTDTNQANMLYFNTNSATSPILGAYACAGSLESPPDSRMTTRNLIANPTVDNLSWIFLPERQSPSTPMDLIQLYHQNLGSQDTWWNNSAFTSTTQALCNAGYALTSSYGAGVSQNNNYTNGYCAEAFGFANAIGTLKRKMVADFLKDNVGYVRNSYLLGVSMGLGYALTYERMFPGQTKALYGVCGVTDLNETGLINAPASLGTALTAAFGQYYISLAASNTGNTPSGDGTWWKVISGPGMMPAYGDTLPEYTTVPSGASSATQTLGQAYLIKPGDFLWFGILRQWRRVLSVNYGTNVVVLDLSISTTSGEWVGIDPAGSVWLGSNLNYGTWSNFLYNTSTQWNNRTASNTSTATGGPGVAAIWGAGFTYALGDIVFVPSSSTVDYYSSNPVRQPEKFTKLPIAIAYGAYCTVSAATAATPPVLTTTSSPTNNHGLTDGTPVILSSMAGGTWSTLNGTVYYAKRTGYSATTFGLYVDQALTTPVNASGLGTYSASTGTVTTSAGGNDSVLDSSQTTGFVTALTGISGYTASTAYGTWSASGFTAGAAYSQPTFKATYGPNFTVNYMGEQAHITSGVFNPADVLSWFQSHI